METLQQIIEKLETYHFECQAGPLENCTDWQALTTRCERLTEALVSCDWALAAWLHTYASELCDEKQVAIYKAMITNEGGTLAYIAKLRKANKQALHPAQEGT